jgi:hypothetical protein
MTLHPNPSEFPLYEENFIFFFISVDNDGDRENETNDRRFKGTVSRDFLLLVFFMNQFPPSP